MYDAGGTNGCAAMQPRVFYLITGVTASPTVRTDQMSYIVQVNQHNLKNTH